MMCERSGLSILYRNTLHLLLHAPNEPDALGWLLLWYPLRTAAVRIGPFEPRTSPVCRLDLNDRIPDQAAFSKNRHGRFRDS